LRLALARSGVKSSPFRRVLFIAGRPRFWGWGHRAFDKLRDSALELDRAREERGLTEGQELLRAGSSPWQSSWRR
jgi:hypothetical protein